MSRRIRDALLAVAVVAVWATVLPGDAEGGETRAGELKLVTERAVVFKDGYCMLVKRGVGETNANSELFTEEVPDSAVLGSFWAVAERGRIVSMTAGVVESKEETKKEVTCSNRIEVIAANRGSRCTVVMTDGKSHTGDIRDVLVTETETPAPAALAGDLHISALSSAAPWVSARPRSAAAMPGAVTMSGVAGDLFVLATDEGDVLLQAGQVRTLTIDGMMTSAERTVTTKRSTKRLTFRFEKANARREIVVMYFCPGIRWIPTYRVELAPEGARDKTARMSLQAEILNEAEDLVGAAVDLVVGQPNFRFRDTISPFSLEATMRNALAAAVPQLGGQFSPNQMFNASFDNARFGERQRPGARAVRSGAGDISLPPELAAAGTQDLFVYSLPRLDLKKGHRAAVSIFDARAPYRDVHTWNLHVKRSDIETSPSKGVASPLVIARNSVWHQIELTNNTAVPWTTGAVMLMQGRQPLAQELLTYTASGGSVRVPVTISVDTRGTFAEEETGREMRALKWGSYHYARIEKRASLRLANSKKIPVDVEITCRIGGRAERASDEGEIMLGAFDPGDWKNYRGDRSVNNHSVVVWRTKVAPGETFAPTVDYHYFTRH